MTSLLPRPRAMFPSLMNDLFDSPWPFPDHNPVRVEESVEDDRYMLRAELPGFDPEKQIHVAAEHGVLTVSAEREDRTDRRGHSEFRYGAFRRSVSLPEGADTSRITAKYHDGILEVVVPYTAPQEAKPITIDVATS